MPSYMHSTLEKIDKHNKYRNKQKLRRLEKVSDELLFVVENKNNIIDNQESEIERLNAIIENYENKLAVQTKKPLTPNYDYMSNTTCFYCIIIVILSVIKSIL